LVLSKLAYLTLCRSIQLLALLARGDAAKDLEILVLRHQLTVLRRQVQRPKLQPADRALLAAVSRVLPRARWSCFFVQPETLLRWHRRLVAGAWTYPHRQTGRPPLDQEVQQLIVRLAKENPRWGYQQIKGELQRLGVRVSATAIRTTLRRHGLDPAPRRMATFCRSFDDVFRSEGAQVLVTPGRAPTANAYAERWIDTVRAECLDWLLIVGRGHLEQVLRVYVEHYNRHRPRRALRLEAPDRPARLTVVGEDERGEVRRRDLLGGLLHEYRRAA
jgi:putative transposase